MITIHEPDVALTDYALFLLCVGLVWRLWDLPGIRSKLRFWSALLFFSTGSAALFGGTVHGFFPDRKIFPGDFLWQITLISIGGAALSGALISARLLFNESAEARVLRPTLLAFGAYVLMVLFGTQKFIVAIFAYSPAMLALITIASVKWRRTGSRSYLFIASAVALSIIAAIAQVFKLGLSASYFNHNATYHMIQAVALGYFYKGFKGLIVAKEHIIEKPI